MERWPGTSSCSGSPCSPPLHCVNLVHAAAVCSRLHAPGLLQLSPSSHRSDRGIVHGCLLGQALQPRRLCGPAHLHAAAAATTAAPGTAAISGGAGAAPRHGRRHGKVLGAKGGQRLAPLQHLQLGGRVARQAGQPEILRAGGGRCRGRTVLVRAGGTAAGLNQTPSHNAAPPPLRGESPQRGQPAPTSSAAKTSDLGSPPAWRPSTA